MKRRLVSAYTQKRVTALRKDGGYASNHDQTIKSQEDLYSNSNPYLDGVQPQLAFTVTPSLDEGGTNHYQT